MPATSTTGSPCRNSPRPRTKARLRVDSSGSQRARKRDAVWEDESDTSTVGEDGEDAQLLKRTAAAAPHSPKRTSKKRPPPPPRTPSRGIWSIILRPLLRSLAFCLTPLGSWFLTLIVPLVLVAGLTYLGVTALSSALSTTLKGLVPSSATLVGLYCSTVGLGCPRKTDERMVASAARQATARASVALDVFQSFLKMGGEESTGLALHPVEAWELATAVKYSGLEERDFLSEQLNELGDRVRDLKDEVIGLNSLGLNSFVWIVHEFTRLEELIVRSKNEPTSLTPEALSQLISSLFEKINTSLGSLLLALDKTIPTATRASDHSRLIFGAMKEQESNVEKEQIALEWQQYIGGMVGSEKGWKGKQLRRDLELTRESAMSTREIWRGLEDTRSGLLGYRNDVGGFKAGIIGFQISGMELSAEDEVRALRAIMGDFRSTLAEAKARGKGSGLKMEDKTLPPAS